MTRSMGGPSTQPTSTRAGGRGNASSGGTQLGDGPHRSTPRPQLPNRGLTTMAVERRTARQSRRSTVAGAAVRPGAARAPCAACRGSEQRAAAVDDRQARVRVAAAPEGLADAVELAAHVGEAGAPNHPTAWLPTLRVARAWQALVTETPFERNAAASERFVALLRSATITSPGELMRTQSSQINVREG